MQGRMVAQSQHAPRKPLLLAQPVLNSLLLPRGGKEGENMTEERDRKVEDIGEREEQAKSKGRWETISWSF